MTADMKKINETLRKNAVQLRAGEERKKERYAELMQKHTIDLVLDTEGAEEEIVQSIRMQFAEKNSISYKQKRVLANWLAEHGK